jgi:C-terminal processing protease CtpA/Prc
MKQRYNHIISMLLALTATCAQPHVNAQNHSDKIDIMSAMRPIYNHARLISDYGHITSSSLQDIITHLKSEGMKIIPDNSGLAHGRITSEVQKGSISAFLFDHPSENIWIQFFCAPDSSLLKLLHEIGKIGYYSGIQMGRDGYIYAPIDSTQNGLFNALFKGNHFIISVGANLPFKIVSNTIDLPINEKIILKNKITQVEKILQVIALETVLPKNHMFKRGAEILTVQERLYGFAQFWTEVKYNFAFFDQVPNLDWDQVYYEYLPVMMAKQTNSEYYRNMQIICALLRDGHTGINAWHIIDLDAPPLECINIGGKAIVQNTSKELSKKLPRGTEILSIDYIPVKYYLETKVFPYISSSTDHILWNDGMRQLLDGTPDSNISLQYVNPGGTKGDITLKRNKSQNQVDWQYEWPSENTNLDFETLDGNVAYVSLNTFGNEQIVTEFEGYISALKKHDHVILDLRNNNGGNSTNGYNILKYFASKPFKTSRWQTREHKAAYKAWGEYVDTTDGHELEDRESESLLTSIGQYWHIEEGEMIEPNFQIKLQKKLIVLIGNHTASAAEDFLVALDDLGIGLLIGQPTYGSTGQPLSLQLPRGASARICTKKDTYPDGREFVGYGIQPDILIEKTVEDYLSGKDVELEMALNVLREH